MPVAASSSGPRDSPNSGSCIHLHHHHHRTSPVASSSSAAAAVHHRHAFPKPLSVLGPDSHGVQGQLRPGTPHHSNPHISSNSSAGEHSLANNSGGPVGASGQEHPRRQVSPTSLHINVCGQDNSLFSGGAASILSLSPGMAGATSLSSHSQHSGMGMDYAGNNRSVGNLLGNGTHLTQVQLSHSNNYCRTPSQDDGRKADQDHFK